MQLWRMRPDGGEQKQVTDDGFNDWFPHNPVVHWMHENEYLVFAWLSALVFLLVVWIAMRNPKTPPGQLQNGVEWIVESMEDVCGGLLGPYAERYLPFIFALFFYILTINLLGIIPVQQAERALGGCLPLGEPPAVPVGVVPQGEHQAFVAAVAPAVRVAVTEVGEPDRRER